MASRNVTTTIAKILTRLLAAVAGLAIVPLMLTFFVLCIALAVIAMPIVTVWWILTGEWLIADSSEVADDN